MTVSTTTTRADYTGNGVTTAFTVPFYFLDNTHLTVLRTVIATGVSTTLTLGTDYSVTGAGVSAGGTVTTTVAPTSAQKISILRNVPLTQLIHYVPNDPFPAATHEQALDQLTMEVQQVSELVSRAITLPPAASGISATLPTAQPTQLLGFNGTGTAITTYAVTDLLTVAGSAGFNTQSLSGDGSTKTFTLSGAPGIIANLEVFISGVRQRPSVDYTLSGSLLTFSSAPASGSSNILARWGTTLGIGVPGSNSVSTAQLADYGVTFSKLATTGVYGTGANNLVQLDANAKLPAIDGSQLTNVNGKQIQPITASVASNALTLTLNPTALDFRSNPVSSGTVNTRTVAAAISVVVPSTATLGTTSGVAARLAVLAIDNSGTVELAVVNNAGAVTVLNLDETGLISTTAISASANSAGTVYSTTARTNVPFRVVGFVDITEATAGTWATAPSTIQGVGGTNATATSPQGCKAWVNFNGVTTSTIRASYNVSSVTRNGTGAYTVNFTNALPDANYSSVISSGVNNSSNVIMIGGTAGTAPTASALYFTVNNGNNGGVSDATYNSVAIFR